VATITGAIVVDDPSEATTTNSITFTGGGTLKGPQNLSESFGELRQMTGGGILAPNFNLVMTGGSATVAGTSIVKGLTTSGGANGTIEGTLILTSTSTLTMSGGSGVTISGPPAGYVSGMKFSGSYHPPDGDLSGTHEMRGSLAGRSLDRPVGRGKLKISWVF
jgi:hypothetical protein